MQVHGLTRFFLRSEHRLLPSPPTGTEQGAAARGSNLFGSELVSFLGRRCLMVQLTRASQELYRRSPDECFATVADLWQHCRQEREFSQDRWHLPQVLAPRASGSQVTVTLGDDGAVPAERLVVHAALPALRHQQGHGQSIVAGDGQPGTAGDPAVGREADPVAHDRQDRSARSTAWPTRGSGMRTCWLSSASSRPISSRRRPASTEPRGSTAASRICSRS